MNDQLRYLNEDIRRKMLELAIEFRYFAADSNPTKPHLAVILSVLLEECAQAEAGDNALPSSNNDNE